MRAERLFSGPCDTEFSSTSLVLHCSLTSPRAIPSESGTVLLFASISSLTLKKYDFLPVQQGILASSPGWKLRGSLSGRGEGAGVDASRHTRADSSIYPRRLFNGLGVA